MRSDSKQERRRFLQLVGSVPLLGAMPLLKAEVTSIYGIRLWPAPDHTRIVLDLDQRVDYKLTSSSHPAKITLRLNQAQPILTLDAVVRDDPRLKAINTRFIGSGSQFEVELVLLQGVDARSFLLPPNESYGHRLVLDLHNRQSPVVTQKLPQEPQQRPQKRVLTIAIDAGHGGEDPGAVGHNKSREKDIVLRVAKRLEKLIQKERGMQAVLIRKGDYYVSLGGRVRKARKAAADLLISVHADGFKRKSAHGASVFTLSEKRATSEMTRWMVRQENRADRIGGVDEQRESNSFAYALRDMERAANLKVSMELAGVVLSELDKIGDLHGKRVHKGSFAVLKAPDFPSMLVETGFITNPREERKLRTSAYQQKLAEAMMKAVRQFAVRYPLTETVPSSSTEAHSRVLYYRVKKGNTLSSIAKSRGISLSALRRLNPGLGDLLSVGQKLRVQ
ncbi:MAG: LysM peptidoglycan-binding domain-containing protein [Gammaproteobacteria bacterium]|nr:LysM peptidoglycan-binding domain-containing protein [Gammaproteobacteria bacterium]